ncbi:MAG TPA: GNAT family N-acetyltransferase [Steroidobacteraceae bacterium]|jgi:CelD/BcsL family acetyltransferase involved in cellulose biosynthesis
MATLTLVSAGNLNARNDLLKPTLRIQQITETDFGGSLQSEWQALESRLSPRTPFTSSLWNNLWWKHLRSRRLMADQDLLVHAVRDSNGTLLAVAPMTCTRRPSVGPLKLRVLCPFGTDPNLTELRSVVCAPQDEVRVIQALREQITRNHSFDWIEWGDLREPNWGGAARLLPAPRVYTRGTNTDFHLELPSSWEEFRASRPRNVKEAIRKCYNSLKRAGHVAHLTVVDSAAGCEEALQVFFTLHSMRSRASDTISHADVCASPAAREFLSAYSHEMAQRGQLRIFQLRVGGAVVATRIGFLFGDELYLYYSGYDTGWGQFSVMTTLLVEVIRWAIDQKLRIVNLSTGADVSKQRWRPVATEYRSLVEVMPGARSRLAFHAFHVLKRWVSPRNARQPVACRPEAT